MRRLLVAEKWSEYAREVIPASAHREQRLETRRAFYGGGSAVLFAVMSLLTPEAEPTPEDLTLLRDILQELNEFAESVKAGRA